MKNRCTKALLLVYVIGAFVIVGNTQRVAILAPDPASFTEIYASRLADALEKHLRLIDIGQSDAAFRSLKLENPFNLPVPDARRVGEIVGGDHFIFVRTDTSKRSSSARPAYYESSAFLFLVNARSGRLERFVLEAKQENSAREAEAALAEDTTAAARLLAAAIGSDGMSNRQPDFEMFDPDSKTSRPPMPYKRIKPEYTAAAFLHDVKATVDAEVSIDEKGDVKKIDIVRWAGFGLDDAVIAAVNKMNWRPGERNSRPLAMRVLLRYNFTKIEKEP